MEFSSNEKEAELGRGVSKSHIHRIHKGLGIKSIYVAVEINV
mgnify:CR=1 FL=1